MWYKKRDPYCIPKVAIKVSLFHYDTGRLSAEIDDIANALRQLLPFIYKHHNGSENFCQFFFAKEKKKSKTQCSDFFLFINERAGIRTPDNLIKRRSEFLLENINEKHEYSSSGSDLFLYYYILSLQITHFLLKTVCIIHRKSTPYWTIPSSNDLIFT